MADASIGTPDQLRDPNYTPALHRAVPLGIQHVLAMFVSNVTPAIIVAGAAGFGFGSNSPDFPELLYLIQMSMLFAGIATLLQTVTIGPGGRGAADRAGHLLCLHPDHDPTGRGQGGRWPCLPLFGGVLIGGIFHALLGHRDRPDPFRPAAAGDRAGRDHDRARAGQGRHPVRSGRRSRRRRQTRKATAALLQLASAALDRRSS